ncbi:MAG: class I SAM-dependent methyltransferase [Chloroflexi bacterium]|nr:class I SAM-dependent methyltransferase [Chloroflexota bacterium]
MNNRIEERHRHGGLHTSNLAFWMISVMHDNPLLPIFRNPYKLLKAAGLKSGQKVLEVGCGPGFFTIPAAKIVGNEGLIYAVDIHPLAVERVKEKIEREGVENVKPVLGNASNTGLPDQSIDLAFLFGLRYIAGGLEDVISEMHRILKPGAVLSFEKTRGSQERLIEEVEGGGFTYSERQVRISLFTKG